MSGGQLGWVAAFSVVLLAGCAATAPTSDDSIRFQTSDRAMQLIEEQGKAKAAMLGYADGTEVVCERVYKKGSHIKTGYCYMRASADSRRLNHQEEFRRISRPGSKCFMGTQFGTGPGDPTRAVSRGTLGRC